MYANKLGRFTTTDPLYIELKRLNDPQRINLFIYGRNNPLKYTDPTGLEINVSGDKEAVDYFEEKFKEGLSFSTKLIKGKFAILDGDGNAITDKKALKKIRKGLSKKEQIVFDTITKGKHQANIVAYNSNDNVDIGANISAGTNAIDMKEFKILDESNIGISASDAAKHEALEAYNTARGMSLFDAQPLKEM